MSTLRTLLLLVPLLLMAGTPAMRALSVCRAADDCAGTVHPTGACPCDAESPGPGAIAPQIEVGDSCGCEDEVLGQASELWTAKRPQAPTSPPATCVSPADRPWLLVGSGRAARALPVLSRPSPRRAPALTHLACIRLLI